MFLLVFLFLSAPGFIGPPKGEPPEFSLTRNLTLGGDGTGGSEILSGTAAAVANDAGTIYVLDPGGFRILIYGKDGRLQGQFGRLGQGPGEFAEPVAITLDAAGNAVIFDTGHHKMAVFKAGGEFLRETRFPSNIHGVFHPVSLPNGNLAFTAYQLDGDLQMSYTLTLFRPDLQPLKTIYNTAMPKLDWNQVSNPSFWSGFLKDQFELTANGFPQQALAGDRLVTALSNAYRGDISDQNGNRLAQFTADYKPKLHSDASKEAFCEPIWQNLAANPALAESLTQSTFRRALGQTEALTTVPPIFALGGRGDGFFVLTDFDLIARRGRIDFFNKNGEPVGRAAYQGSYHQLTATATALYSVGPNDNDDIVVQRFQIGERP